ncbi:uncharacterized protein LOC132695522 isoform X2 [Cylas formicarius]|nr:uncharacterized protein LOC132695522 isoform X2 [Cylas formicarius]
MQFVKVAPCPLSQKAQEQIKKVEEIKKERKEIRDETEDWQQNLDNWKSSRRKRQEHIIERVVEVKKLTEQEEFERSRRKSKTFSEMIEERKEKGRPKFTIPIYDDESNDLSDYGIGSSSSKTNSIKDVDTDDSCSILDEKDHQSFDSTGNKDTSSNSNQSQSEDETNNLTKKSEHVNRQYLNNITANSTPVRPSKPKPNVPNKASSLNFDNKFNDFNTNKEPIEQYTYEGAIQDYRSRIQSKIKVDESIFTKNRDVIKSKEYSEAQSVLPKGEISKRKGLFEVDKPLEINHMETHSFRRLSEDFANARSIKDRLKSLERSTDQSIKSVDKSDIQISVKQRLMDFNTQADNENNNVEKSKPNKISNYLLDKSNGSVAFENQKPRSICKSERSVSPEAEMYLNKLNMFNRDLDNLMGGKSIEDNLGDYCNSSTNYPPSLSSVELTDREDSGIHTADVSCSVSQADEPTDTETEAVSNAIPKCIEKLKISEEANAINQIVEEPQVNDDEINNSSSQRNVLSRDVINSTKEFLEDLIRDATENIKFQKWDGQTKKNINVQKKEQSLPEEVPSSAAVPESFLLPKTVIYENIELKPYPNNLPVDFITADFSLSTKKLEPPKVKPPPPPPPEDEQNHVPKPVKRINSTKRIKKEIHSKRSSFLGLDDTNIDLIDPDVLVEKPPDINSFLQKESKLEKSLYKKMQEENRSGLLSKVESQDSGLDIDRGRLSSDTWCSSIGDSSTPSHERQDSEHTNSITSEEDEITKKEREIIEMVEKEEKSRDNSDVVNLTKTAVAPKCENFEPTLGSEQFNSPYFPQSSPDFLEDHDSEVLKVEQELRQLEREELERQRENRLFQESRNRARLQNNRHSLENICDDYHTYVNTDYRKSMPELQHLPLEFRKSIGDVTSAYYERSEEIHYRKSMPDIQHAYHASADRRTLITNNLPAIDHRKSMPELQHDARRSAFISPPPVNRQPIMPKPLRTQPKPRILTKPSLKALSAVPRPRHNDNWIQPKANPEVKNYNQHWVFQEAELRRLSEQHQKNAPAPKNWQQHSRQEKPLPDSVIHTITQRVQNRTSANERIQALRRPDVVNKEYSPKPYINHSQTMGHAMPSVPYSPPAKLDDSLQDRMLSVSGKKKCSYCNNELGRGAAMIIESLCLFYHMECFKCCVCRIQLGDGRMGTDVRVRNQKLHCHNCFSSDDGVKFSCV